MNEIRPVLFIRCIALAAALACLPPALADEPADCGAPDDCDEQHAPVATPAGDDTVSQASHAAQRGPIGVTRNGSSGSDGSLGVGIVGDGGDGGSGGTPSAITINWFGDANDEEIVSSGSSAHGINVRSRGGTGGDGGYGVGIVGFGGQGGSGGNGGTINVTSEGSITTSGSGARGIFASSRGNNGGDGGDAGGIDGEGGDGGSGGRGGTITINSGGTITTTGSNADGILAQSTGATGGAGGAGGGIVAIGGGSSGGGRGGTITINNAAAIEVSGSNARGIAAQSIGGFGGGGGGAGGIVGIGGQGSTGGNGGTVTINHSGTVVTRGVNGHGLFGESVGGGGGSAGGSGGAVSLGGSGSSAGNGGTVRITSTGDVTTENTRARGIFAQSIGGGGGDGAGSGGVVSLGGSGGSAGTGGSITVEHSVGTIATGGFAAHGILGQSVGGGGGSGAGSGGLVSLGGGGSSGGNAGSVTVTNSGAIQTGGASARGIFAQSIGGGGGDGAGSGGAVSIGGGGSGSGSGRAVTVTNSGDVITAATIGRGAHGIFAQSIGGGGGSGAGSGGIVSVGGGGSRGGSGGTVDVTNSGNVETNSAGSRGIFAQSIGGGGGDGAGSGGAVSVGGAGSSTGNGARVTVDNSGTVRTLDTSGSGSHSIFAQSVGGGGGSGAGSGGLISVGGRGQRGGNGGTVTVTNSGDLEANGQWSRGIFAQSIGGGGGDGSGSGGAFSVGGAGSSTGNGGNVDVSNSGTILASGNASQAILAQSIGGGGGDGGGSGGLISIGGSAGAGGSAGTVDVTNTGQLTTTQADSSGIFAQSVGGGGGNGAGSLSVSAFAGFSLGGAGGVGGGSEKVTVDSSDGSIETSGDRSAGIFAQSVGGGGGNGGHAITITGGAGGSVSVAVGGRAGNGGPGGAVDIDNGSTIITRGDDANGILAQSVGGGGGNGGFSIAGAGSDGIGASIAFGGRGGQGGNGGGVDVTDGGVIDTSGDGSIGILAQSVGGGGGNGGFRVAAGLGGAGGAALNLGGSGNIGGNGSTVDVTSTGTIITRGTDAHAILAQSVGGGGGNGSFGVAVAGGGTGAGSISLGATGAGGGSGSTVDLHASGTYGTAGDRAAALFAQSVGGGGGNGGANLAGAGGGTGSGALTVGGFGGRGGTGGTVTLTSDSTIMTLGNEAHGVLAQSIGGGGGNGGFSISGSGAGSGSATIGIGGGGAAGGNGGSVVVDSSGLIVTAGNEAHGTFAQSIGGGGGNGAFNISGSGAGQYSGTIGIGGSGGSGSNGGAVTLTSAADIATTGRAASGLFAQSIGGGGGNGNFNISGSGAGTGSLSIGVGGFGDNGGNGGAVIATNNGSIFTSGNDAYGMHAQSVGGGGGKGGLSFSGSVAGPMTKSVAFSLGGGGDNGGSGGQVDATNNELISTSGRNAHGILAQSLGGGGGDGGMSIAAGLGFGGPSENANLNAQLSIGGKGGDGSSGGIVNVFNNDTIITSGQNADAISAQSIGGGGGAGGSSITGFIGTGGATEGRTVNVGVSVGGAGGDGSHGGAVTVINSGDIVASGVGSRGIAAQSVGGGGGIGGRSNALSVVTGRGCPKPAPGQPPLPPRLQTGCPDKQNVTLTVAVGGAGGGASDGGVVDVTNTGTISTSGDEGHGIFAQSIGGGGGDGGNGIIGLSELTDSPVPPELIFLPADRVSFFKTVSIAVGGNAGASGDGGAVGVNNVGSISTRGNNATGIFAQSIGAGGGNGGNAVIGLTGTVGMGGADGSTGNGGIVTVDQSGDISTTGNVSHGVFAQSVGGGGGTAGNVERGLAEYLNVGIGVGFSYCALQGITDRRCGNGGDGGAVIVTTTGDITTLGNGAQGIFAQSVGGGGGIAGDLGVGIGGEGLGSFTGSVGGAGSAGNVTVNHDGNIVTMGTSANAIFAQSAGGQGMGGPVDVTVNGTIAALGANGSGIVAQSTGDAGGGNITIDLQQSADVIGGLYSPGLFPLGSMRTEAAAVRIVGGSANTLTNAGTVSSVAGIDGLAIATGSGDDAILNSGTIVGSIDLGSGINIFRNLEGGHVETGTRFDLGSDPASLLQNAGDLWLGGLGRTITTQIVGDFDQTASGTFHADLDVANNLYDALRVSGQAVIDGAVDINVVNGGDAMPGDHTTTLLFAGGGLIENGVILRTDPSIVVTYGPLLFSATAMTLDYNVNFAPQGMTGNRNTIGDYVNRLQSSGGFNDFAPIVDGLIRKPTAAGYSLALDQLSPEIYLQSQMSAIFSARSFGDALFGCHSGIAAYSRATDGACGWMNWTRRSLERDAGDQSMGFTEDSIGISGGFERVLGNDWRLGFAMAYELSKLANNANVAAMDGKRFQGGLSFTRNNGGSALNLSMTAGSGRHETVRQVDFGTNGILNATAKQNILFASSRSGFSHTFRFDDVYIRPYADLLAHYVETSDFMEAGGGGANLVVFGSDDWYTSISPGVEFVGNIATDAGNTIQPFVRIGMTRYISDIDPGLTSMLSGASAEITPFMIHSESDKTFADLNVGLDVLSSSENFLKVYYSMFRSDDFRNESVSIRFGGAF